MDWPFNPAATDPPVMNNSVEWMRQTGLAPIATSGIWALANQGVLTMVRVRARFTVKKLYCYNGSAVSGNACIALYSQRPGGNYFGYDRLTTSGSVAQAGVSQWQAFDVPDVVIAPGMYWLTYQLDNITGQVMRLAALSGAGMVHLLGNVKMDGAPAFPLPASLSSALRAGDTVNVPLLAMGGVA